jgi:hypothetical protein
MAQTAPKTEPIQEGEYTITEVQTSPATLRSIVGAEIDSQIATAKAYPRSITQFKRRAMSLVTISVEVAESCKYGLPRAGKIVTGPSVRLAEIVSHAYGNIRSAMRIVERTGAHIVAQGICHDLETNTAITVEVSRSILQHEWKDGKKTGRMIPMNEDMQTLAGNAAGSIALRNAIFRVVPKAVWWDVYVEAEKMAKGDIATLKDRRTKAIDWFKSKGVKEVQIFRVLEVKGVDDIDLDKLATLSAMKTAVSNNEASLENLFPADDPKNRADRATRATETKLDKTANPVKDTTDKMAGDLDKKPEEKK